MAKIKLCIDKVPKLGLSNLREVLTEYEWIKCERLVQKQSKGHCQICNEPGTLDCHEQWSYEYDFDVLSELHALLCKRYSTYIKGQTSLLLTKTTKNEIEAKYIFPLVFKNTTVGQWNNCSHDTQCSLIYQNLSEIRAARLNTLYSMLVEGVEGVQRLSGLIAVCRDCHLAKHFDFAVDNGKIDNVTDQLKYINGWDDDQLKSYLNYKVAQYEARNKSNWVLDASLLTRIRPSNLTQVKLGIR